MTGRGGGPSVGSEPEQMLPPQLVGSLVAQIDERFPGAREPDPGAGMHPAARLAKALSRVSERELGPRGERDDGWPPRGLRVARQDAGECMLVTYAQG